MTDTREAADAELVKLRTASPATSTVELIYCCHKAATRIETLIDAYAEAQATITRLRDSVDRQNAHVSALTEDNTRLEAELAEARGEERGRRKSRNWSDDECIAFATAYDGEDAAQCGEPNPWRCDFESDDARDDWTRERLACVRSGLAALAQETPND